MVDVATRQSYLIPGLIPYFAPVSAPPSTTPAPICTALVAGSIPLCAPTGTPFRSHRSAVGAIFMALPLNCPATILHVRNP